MASLETWIVISDVHIPFQSKPLVAKVCKLIKQIRPHGIVIAGDFLDLYSLSRHHADSLRQLRNVTLSDEYRAGQEVIIDLERALPKGAKRSFLFGNHEDNYWRELDRGDRGKLGNEIRSPTEALKLRERGYDVQEQWKEASVTLGDHLDVTHGIWTGIHTAKKALDDWQGSVMFGHSHRMQTHYAGKRAAFNIGGLYDATSSGFHYMARTQRARWTNGFALVDINSHGDYWTTTVPCYGDHFVVDGRMY